VPLAVIPNLHAVKSSLLLSCLFCFLAASTMAFAADDAAASAESTVYITMHTSEPMQFERRRYGDDTGQELIHSTLVQSAAEQAEYAELKRKVIVVPEGEAAPAGALELRLHWGNGVVTAEVVDGVSPKPKYLGVVSRTELSYHPNGQKMISRVHRAGLRDVRAEALMRAQVEMNLYLALQRVARELNRQSKKS
jgi:hypothetical protein